MAMPRSLARLVLTAWLLGAPVLASVAGPAAPAQADGTRLQVLVKQVHVFDDSDPDGQGEFRLFAMVLECNGYDVPCSYQCGDDSCNTVGDTMLVRTRLS